MVGTFELRVGDQVPYLVYRVGIDLTLALSATFSLRDKTLNTVFIDDQPAIIANGTYVIDGVPQVFTPADGILLYAWAPGDTATARASCAGLFKVTWPQGQETWPSKGEIRVVIGPNY